MFPVRLFTEAEAVRRAIYLAGQTDTPLYIAHMTCREAIAELQKAKGTGQRVSGETCTHYLTTTKEVLDNPDFNEAAKFVCSPLCGIVRTARLFGRHYPTDC